MQRANKKEELLIVFLTFGISDKKIYLIMSFNRKHNAPITAVILVVDFCCHGCVAYSPSCGSNFENLTV
jgi:hypothetical protein